MSDTAAIMNAMDSVSGSAASAYLTLEGTRYCLMQMISFESSMEIKSKEIPILGRTGKGNKPGGWSGSWKAKAHYNQSVLRKYWLEYKASGVMPTFDIQVTNDDATTTVGRQTVILKDCLTKGGTLAKFDADAEVLDEEIEGTFDDWEMPEQFSLIDGMTT